MSKAVDLHIHASLRDPHGVCGPEACQDLFQQASQLRAAPLVLTPHADAFFHGSELTEELDALLQFAQQAQPDLQLLPGCEFLIRSLDDIRLVDEGLIPTLATTPYLLVEFRPDARTSLIAEAVYELKLRGLTPLLAHPERLPALQDEEKAKMLLREGALFQGTLASLSGLHGTRAKSMLLELLRRGQIHSLASDFHGGDYLGLWQNSVMLLERQFGSKLVEAWIVHNPAALLSTSNGGSAR